MAKMSDDELKGILQAKLQQSLGYLGGRLSSERIKALRYYNGDPFGNESAGKSQVVTKDVAEAIDAVMPSLMKIFFSGDEIVRFEPQQPQDEEGAQQATDYVNWIALQQNESYSIFFDWFKDALLQKLGVVKIWWEESTGYDREEYTGLTDDELTALLADDAVELKQKTSYPAPQTMEGQMDATQGDGAPPSAMLHDVVIYRTFKDGHVCMAAVPPDEFLTDRRATTIDASPFNAHRKRMTETDLLEAGYDPKMVKGLPWNDDIDLSLERIERYKKEDEMPYRTGAVLDKSMKEIWVSECYVRLDYDGDGKAELRKITVAGDASFEILDNEECDDHPFASICPNPMPHKLFGQSLADQTMDVQLIKSTVLRNVLDNHYQANNRRIAALEGQVNLDDLLNNRAGGIVRVKSMNALAPIEFNQIGQDGFNLIEYMDQTREQRTGVRRFDPGLTPDALNKSATEANIQQNMASQRIELIARTFAETGVKAVFRRVLELVCKYQQKAKMIRLRGRWVKMDPSSWNSKMDMSVSVGLGTGNKDQELAHLMALVPVNQGLLQIQGGADGPILSWQNLYDQLKRLQTAAGLKGGNFYTDPSSPEAQQMMQQKAQKPDPKTMEVQGKMQLEQQKAQSDQQMQAQKLQSDHALQQAKIQADAVATQNKAQTEAEMKREQLVMEMNLRREQLAAELQLKREQMAAEIGLKRELGYAGIQANAAVSSDVRPGGQPG